MLSYRATLDLPDTIVRRISAWLSAHRRRHDRRPWQRAKSCWTQAVMVCRWMLDATPIHRLARDHGLSQATCYRYLHEALDVVADRAPDLHEVLDAQHAHGAAFVCLDGTLIATNAVHIPTEQGKTTDAWYSGKHHRHGGNTQVLTDHTGFPIWTSPVSPGATHDLTAARQHVLPALYPAAAQGLKTLTVTPCQSINPRRLEERFGEITPTTALVLLIIIVMLDDLPAGVRAMRAERLHLLKISRERIS